jgi:hypothetical protein
LELPNSELAVVEARKVTEYLLNASHPDNGGKARFFETLGYAMSDVMQLVAALRTAGASGEVVQRLESRHGTKYVVDGQLSAKTETGRSRAIRTVWIVESGDEVPRLVTAYPQQG